jgi:hypothetical protein
VLYAAREDRSKRAKNSSGDLLTQRVCKKDENKKIINQEILMELVA